MQVVLHLRSYIAAPYWPAKNRCIEIEKKSGLNRQKSDDKRLAALKAECDKQGVTYEQYLAWKREGEEQWYRREDGTIYIPRHQIAGAMVEAISQAPRALRGGFSKDNFRGLVDVSDFVTDRRVPDGVFARFVKLDASNQRSWQENEYLGQYLDKGTPFSAEGQIVPHDERAVDVIKRLLVHVVTVVGIGSARKMGFGRGTATFAD